MFSLHAQRKQTLNKQNSISFINEFHLNSGLPVMHERPSARTCKRLFAMTEFCVE